MPAFADALEQAARRHPGKTAAVDDARRIAYADLDALVDGVAAGLVAGDVGPGDVVTSQLPNCIEALALCLAANRIGAVHNPVVPIYRDREVRFITAEAGTAVFVDRRDHDLFGYAATAAASPRPHGVEDPAFLVYTSGSTADPKGVLHSDATLRAECAAQATYHGLRDDDVFVMASPVGHVSGLLYGVLLPVWLGATAVLLPTWDPGRFLELVASEGGTFSGGATPFLQGVVDHPELDRFDISTLRLFPCGGADVPPDLIRRASERLGARTGRGYGSTEFPSITSSAGPGEPLDRRAETDGRPIGGNEIRIVDGEIQARGPEVFLGYRNPALDADACTDDGWFRTGDAGTVDGDGYLTVTGRLKDIIIRAGEKISAREVEELLARHDRVAAVAVVACPDARTGERAVAWVVPPPAVDPPTLDDLAAFLTDLGLSRRKLPEQIELADALPLTASGKVDKPALRARTPRH